MSEKKYPTRMHELCQMEPMEVATFEMLDSEINTTRFEFYLNFKGIPILSLGGRVLDTERFAEVINHPERIIRKPRLTEAQIKYLKAALTLEFEWLAKDADGSTYFYERKETKFPKNWGCRAQSIKVFVEEVRELVSWDDPEPLDIAATLKAAGVEV